MVDKTNLPHHTGYTGTEHFVSMVPIEGEQTVNQSDMIEHVADKTGSSRVLAAAVIAAFSDAISTSLAKGDVVRLGKLGTLKTVETKARTARNPKTGEKLQVAASRKARFVPSKSLKEAVAA